MTGKQLKNSILQWAIQGKLVPQDPNDEPASVLLEKIRTEKARLVKEGKIKKDKKESIIYRGEDNSYYEKILATGESKCIDEEIPYEIPNGWEWCRFSSIYWQLTDGTHSTPKYTQSGIPFLSVKDMSTGKLSFTNTKFISEEEHQLLSQRCHPCKGDLLLSKVGTTGIPLIIDDDREFSIFVSLALIKFFPKFIDSSFLIALLKSPLVQMQVKENTRGVGNKNWVLTAISNTLLAIPPLREQKCIVDKIAILSPYTEKYAHSESKISRLNKEIGISLKKSILQEAIQGKLVPQDASEVPASILLQHIKEEKLRLVKEGKLKKKDVIDSTIFRGDDNKYYEQIGKNCIDITESVPFDIPDNWVWTRIGYLFAHNNGKQLNKGNSSGTLMEYITTSNLYWDGFRLDNLKKMPFEENEIERCQAIKGDLLVCEGGDVGRTCIWTFDYPIMLQNHIHKLRAFLPLYTKYFFYVFYFYNLIGLIGGKGIGIQGFSAKALHNTIIPLPPLKEQERIVRKIETVFDWLKGN